MPVKHGHRPAGSRSPTYSSWEAMRGRCNNPRWAQYKDYGGRGIRCCPRWCSFENFLADMGERPAGCSLDRIDTDGNYEPGNCRWATTQEQSRTRRTTQLMVAFGEVRSLTEWCRLYRKDVRGVLASMQHGYSFEEALSLDRRKRGTRNSYKRLKRRA